LLGESAGKGWVWLRTRVLDAVSPNLLLNPSVVVPCHPTILLIADRALANELGLRDEVGEGMLLLPIDRCDTLLDQIEALGARRDAVTAIVLVSRCLDGGMQIGAAPVTAAMVRTTPEDWARAMPKHLKTLDLFLVQGVISESLPIELAGVTAARVRLADGCRPGELHTVARGDLKPGAGSNHYRPFKRIGA